jgi:hypothetical protein
MGPPGRCSREFGTYGGGCTYRHRPKRPAKPPPAATLARVIRPRSS